MNKYMRGEDIRSDAAGSIATQEHTINDMDGEAVFRAFFNANKDDYMAYWDRDLVLKIANFHLSAEYMPTIERVRDTGQAEQFEADQNGRTFDFRAYPAMNASGECLGIALNAWVLRSMPTTSPHGNRPRKKSTAWLISIRLPDFRTGSISPNYWQSR